METPCIAGWHVNEEIANNLMLITVGFIPDIVLLICIAAGMLFKDSNIGADPGVSGIRVFFSHIVFVKNYFFTYRP